MIHTLAPVFKSAEAKKLPDGVFEFVASDETVDRYGDIVRASGWDLKSYRANPVVLWMHQKDQPVARAVRAWVEGTQLKIRVKMAEPGTSPFIDSLISLMNQDIVRAVSVGFLPTVAPNVLRDPKNDRITGFEYVGQELLENSLVTVPANPNALQLAKSLGIRDDHIARVFSSLSSPQGASARSMVMQKAALTLATLGAPSNR